MSSPIRPAVSDLSTPPAAPGAAEAVELARQALIGRLVGGVTHEIGNPLTSITNAFFLLKAEKNRSQPGNRLISLIQTEVERIAASVDALRRYASPVAIPSDDRTLGGLVANLRLVLQMALRRNGVALECREAAAAVDLSALGRDAAMALLPLVVAAVERAQTDDRIELDGQEAPGERAIGLTLAANRIGEAERRYLTAEDAETESDWWLGVCTGLVLTRDALARFSGRIAWERNASGAERVELRFRVADRPATPRRSQL